MHVVIGRVRAASVLLATVAATTLIVGAIPARAATEATSEACTATDGQAAADVAAARKTARKHMVLGFAKTMATSMLPFGGMIGHGGVGAVASALGQAAAQTAASSAQPSAQERLAQVAAATPRDCAA